MAFTQIITRSASTYLIPAPSQVIPASPYVIPASPYVIPAKAGIHLKHSAVHPPRNVLQNSSKLIKKLLLLTTLALASHQAQARLEVCNQTDLVLMVAVGYDTADERVASEGWWKIYPGFCEVPIDVTLVKGGYYLHAESNPRSTMPNDSFTWGEKTPLCVELADFRLPDARVCPVGKIAINFNLVDKNWRNTNQVDIFYSKRRYENIFRVKVAGLQRLMSLLGYPIGEIDGQLGEVTVTALNQILQANRIFGFDFKRIYPVLEAMIAEKQKLDN